MGNSQSQWRFIARKIICKCRIFQLAYLMPYWLGYGGYGGTLVLGDWPWVVLATTLWNLSIVGGLPSIVTCIYQEISGFCLPLYCILIICSWWLAYDARAPIVVSFFMNAGLRSRFLKVNARYSGQFLASNSWWKKCTTTEKKHIKPKLKRDFMANMPFRISILCIFPTHPIKKVRPQPRISSIHWMSPAGELWSALRKLPVMLPREAEMRGCLV